MTKAFGPVDQKVAFGEGWVVLSPAQGGYRQVAFVGLSGGSWQVVGSRHNVVDTAGAVTLRATGDTVLIETRRESAPQFTAFRRAAEGLKTVDYYAEKAPEPAVKSGHFVLVNKRLNVLWHYEGGKLVKTYRVATGRQTEPPAPTWADYRTNFFTPEGTYPLTSFVINPPFNALKPGDVSYAGGAPGNPLGTRWMGFPVLENDNAGLWGIHGTSQPDLIGTWASDGCIRMYTAQAEELFAVLKGKNATLQVVRQ